MNNERYQEIIDEVYENYKITIQTQRDLQRKEVQRLRSQGKRVKVALIELLSKEEFINKCKTDTEFSEKWRLKIEERCLSWEERDFPILRHSTKLITVTYQENKIEIYD